MSVINITTENFEKEVLNSDKPVFIDFYADWCGPCKMVSPIVHQLAGEYEGKIRFAKINVDEVPELAGKFGVSSIPAMFFVADRQIKGTHVGYASAEQLREKIESWI